MPEKNNSVMVNVSTMSILKVFFVILVLLFLYVIRDIIAILFVSIILAAAILPAVEFFERRKFPRWTGIMIVYLAALSLISLVIGLLIPALTVQVSELAANFPDVYNKIVHVIERFATPVEPDIGRNIQEALQAWGRDLANAAGNIFSTITSIVGGIITLFALIVLTFYMLLQDDGLQRLVQSVAPKAYHQYVMRLLSHMQDRIALWLRGQLILSLVVGVLTFIGLTVFGIKFALVLALVAAITELIPYLGPILGAIPAVFIAFTQSPTQGLAVVILYVLVQQLENHLLVPRIMSKVVGLNPVVVIIVILIGAKVGGIVGAIVAIPVATALSVIVKEIFDQRALSESSR